MLTPTLSQLLTGICGIPKAIDCPVSGLTLDSRAVKPGNVFFAYQGVNLDGRQFISDAISRGASAVLTEANANDGGYTLQNQVPIISIHHLRQQMASIAANFYSHPERSLCIVGITGTNGKTSCSHFIASALQQLHITCGVIGTLGNGIIGQIQPSNLTTPDAITLQATFAEFLQLGAQAVAMEVSSHSIDQGRVNEIPFEIAVFTNLTQDHLDYHGSMESYGATKRRLFADSLLPHAVINADDDFGREMIRTLQDKKDIIAYSVKHTSCDVPLVYAQDIHLDISGLSATVFTPWGEGKLKTSLIGLFNLSNVLAALATLCLLKIPFEQALKSLELVKPVPGRMETLGGKGQPLVVVDYAHTPDSLEKALLALREHCQGRLLCLFGCGGNRDKGKRPLMAKIAEKYADVIMVTNDNPRHEAPEQIAAEIMAGFEDVSRIIVQLDRSKAIQDIIQCAQVGDCVLVAGKGAEAYQQIGDRKIAFSDVEQVRRWLGSGGLASATRHTVP
jgi:UDP-N-acetylmuramoyl-L-alanyl-D-glutamate--2,6-diaminopimelate ligase